MTTESLPEADIDEAGRNIFFAGISTATMVIAGFDPQLEVMKPYLLWVGSIGTLACSAVGLRHHINTRRRRSLLLDARQVIAEDTIGSPESTNVVSSFDA
jgi:hypothetical protein